MGTPNSHDIPGLHTWTLNPDEIIRNPIPYRWAAQHLTRTTRGGIAFIHLPPGKSTWAPNLLTPHQEPPGHNPSQPYLYMEADPDEETNTWECRTWWNNHPKYSRPDNYLLPLAAHAASSPPQDTITLGPVQENTQHWTTCWTGHTSKGPSNPALMVFYQFSVYAVPCFRRIAAHEPWNMLEPSRATNPT